MNFHRIFLRADKATASAIAFSAPPRAELLSRKEAAQYLGIEAQTLAVWATTHRYNLPMVKIGRLAKYRVADLEAFIKARTVGGPIVLNEGSNS